MIDFLGYWKDDSFVDICRIWVGLEHLKSTEIRLQAQDNTQRKMENLKSTRTVAGNVVTDKEIVSKTTG